MPEQLLAGLRQRRRASTHAIRGATLAYLNMNGIRLSTLEGLRVLAASRSQEKCDPVLLNPGGRDGEGETDAESRDALLVERRTRSSLRPFYRLNAIKAKNSCDSSKKPEGSTARISFRRSRSNTSARPLESWRSPRSSSGQAPAQKEHRRASSRDTPRRSQRS
jgi:hypothetical protein